LQHRRSPPRRLREPRRASGDITEFATGFPGYNSRRFGRGVLKENGYNTAWFGKMHNVMDWMSSQAGPFDLWPNGLGFEHFYGFLGGDSDQWHPALYENTTTIEPYVGKPDYILDVDLADEAIAWMRMQHALAPNKAWLLYYATGTAHARIMHQRTGLRNTRASSTRAGIRSSSLSTEKLFTSNKTIPRRRGAIRQQGR
jgi:arylsulfatase A-like enzyme